ncbi:MAG: hypothetical protein D6705_04380 [Deltaproteobacteria bacterium]|nr:MAG: hypothetical protein D6705_04380 [Deltaproteobacteria bacterium]
MDGVDPTEPPLVRARATQDMLAVIDEFEPGLEAKLRAKAPPEALARVEEAASTAYLPTRVTSQVVLAAVDLVGKERAVKLWRFFFVRRYGRSPILRAIVSGALRLFGISPASLYRQVQRNWHTTYRNMCVPSVYLPDANRAVVHLRDVHPEILEEYPDYLLALQGGLEGMTEMAGADGASTMTIDRDAREVQIEITW